MKILDDIKAKREAATQGKWKLHEVAWRLQIQDESFEPITPITGKGDLRLPLEVDAAYIARMDPRTVEAMENIIRAAFPLTQESWPDGETPEFYRKELRKTFEALKQIGEDH